MVDETEKGWYIQYIDRDPKAVLRANSSMDDNDHNNDNENDGDGVNRASNRTRFSTPSRTTRRR